MNPTTPTTLSAPTALIAEDEPLLARALQADLAQHWPQLRVVANVGDGVQAVQQALKHQPTLCFLDIRMPALSGLEVAQALAEDWPDGGANGNCNFPLLVFITAYEHYAVQAFEAQAVDYLLKPVQPERLASCCERLRQRLAQRSVQSSAGPGPHLPPAPSPLAQAVEQLRALLAPTEPAATTPKLEVLQAGVGATVHLVPVDDVIYFEAADKYLRVITAEREHLIRLSLRELLPRLDAQRFWQVHRGLVVQARWIASATREESGRVSLTLRGRTERLSVSRLYAHLFKAM
ncbi:MAG: LytTR family DNA-binding domain-containing protein [Burkholderiaceae bacterium]